LVWIAGVPHATLKTLAAVGAALSGPFDIFREQPDGNTYWIEAAENLEAAKAHALVLVQHFHGQFVIVDNATGDETFIPAKQ
jgi:hypothetical protein